MNGLIFGVMTGTSMDGIDVCLLDTKSGGPLSLKDFESKQISKSLKNIFLSLLVKGPNELERSQIASNQLSLEISKIVNFMIIRNNLNKKDILGVGVHGQTVRHNPEKFFTIQLCNPSIISEMTELTVVSDFRSKDIAAGGQGAPLAPLFHYEICKHHSPCSVVNIGGIANISSIIKCNNKKTKIDSGYDSGPGNCLSDMWCQKKFKKDYDNNGKLAGSGTLNEELLDYMLSDPFFYEKAPKSTGIHYFNQNWLEEKLSNCKQSINDKDVLTTVIELTALTITKDLPPESNTVYVCGGGVKNSFLIERIKKNVKGDVYSTEKIGWNPQLLEASCFAWLALKRINKEKLNLKKITGSKKPIMLGSITSY